MHRQRRGARVRRGVLYRMAWLLGAGQTQAAAHLTHELYLESAAMILAWFPSQISGSARQGQNPHALSGLAALAPKPPSCCGKARKRKVPVGRSRGGSSVLRAGASVPVDGVRNRAR